VGRETAAAAAAAAAGVAAVPVQARLRSRCALSSSVPGRRAAGAGPPLLHGGGLPALRWPAGARSSSSREHVASTAPLEQLVERADAELGFVDLLRGLLDADCDGRATASQAVCHRFCDAPSLVATTVAAATAR